MIRLTLSAFLVLSIACVPWRRGNDVTMTARLASADVRTNEVLTIQRTITNRSSRPIYLRLGTTDVAFAIKDTAGRPACFYEGVHTLGLIVITIRPDSSGPRNTTFPIRLLAKCGPGRYTVDASTRYHRSEDRDEGRPLLHAPLTLVIRDSTSTR